MPEWTRKNDAHIALECEGWQRRDYEQGGYWVNERGAIHPLPHYRTDANARDRAAEAWRKKKEGRSWVLTSAGHGIYENGDVARATLFEEGPWATVVAIGDGEHALLWALYRATKKDGKA